MSGIRIFVLIVVMLIGGSAARMRNEREKGAEYIWKTGNWGTCFPNSGSCGDGVQKRAVWCSHVDGRAALEYLCEASSEPATDSACLVECSHEKEEFQWDIARWGPCQIVTPPKPWTHGENGSKAGRIRENLGVMQRNVTCILISHETRTQHVVDDSSCSKLSNKPESVRICKVPRPQDCVVGAFTKWSTCEDPINCDVGVGVGVGGLNQTRMRTVLVAPMYGGRACPPLVETRPCERPSACVQAAVREDGRGEYRIKVGDWRRCQAPSSIVPADVRDSRYGRGRGWNPYRNYRFSNVFRLVPNHYNRLSLSASVMSPEEMDSYYTYEPEVGYQTRDVSCRDSKGAAVDLSLCLQGRGQEDVLPPTVQPCVVPEDCVVNQWSGWTKLQDGCLDNSGRAARPQIQVRRREVVRLNHGTGRACPRLIERRVITDPEQLPNCGST